MTPRLDLAACLLSASLAGCDIGGACTLNIVPAIEVEVRDRITNEFLTTTPRGVIREGTFEDSLGVTGFSDDVPPRVTTLAGADERAGRYVVQVEADGYLPWDTTGVRVAEDDCHVRTATFTAALDPAQ